MLYLINDIYQLNETFINLVCVYLSMGKGFGELFSSTFGEYLKKFVPILKIFVFLYLIPMVIVAILLVILFTGVYSSLGVSVLKTGSFDLSQVALSQGDIGSLVLLFLGIFVFVIVLGIFYVWMAASYVYISFSKGGELPFDKTFAFARKNFWRYVGLTLLTIVCLIPLYILLIIPGIIFTVFWAFSSYILLSGNVRAWDSMKQSKALVKGRWWRVFGYGLLLLLIIFVISFVAGFIPFVGSIVSSLVLTPFMILFFKNFWLELKHNSVKK